MLTRHDVPSVGRCRELAGIIGGEPQWLWRRRWLGSKKTWIIDDIEAAAPAARKPGWFRNCVLSGKEATLVPAYPLGQMLDWARRRGMAPKLEWSSGAGWWGAYLDVGAVHPVKDFDNLAPNALADAIIAASKADKKPDEAEDAEA